MRPWRLFPPDYRAGYIGGSDLIIIVEQRKGVRQLKGDLLDLNSWIGAGIIKYFRL